MMSVLPWLLVPWVALSQSTVADPVRAESTATVGAAAAESPSPPADTKSPVAVTTRLRPDPSSIGDLLQLEVIAAYPKGYSVNVPIGLQLEPLHLVGIEEGEPESTGQGLRKVFTLKLQYFDVGEAAVPAFDLTYVTPGGQVETISVPEQEFTVESLLANEANPERKPEDPGISLAYPNRWAEIAIYSAGAAILASILVWLSVRRFLRRTRPEPVVPPVPPHERAMAELDRLEQQQLPEQERYQEYYLQLTEIIREYLEGRFGIEALDRTTDEIRRALLRQDESIEPIQPPELVHFLQRADLIKFARHAATEEEAAKAMAYARDLVASTTKRDDDQHGRDQSKQRTDSPSQEVA